MTDAEARETQRHLQRLQAIPDLFALAGDEARRREAGMGLAESHAYAIRRSQMVARGGARPETGSGSGQCVTRERAS